MHALKLQSTTIEANGGVQVTPARIRLLIEKPREALGAAARTTAALSPPRGDAPRSPRARARSPRSGPRSRGARPPAARPLARRGGDSPASPAGRAIRARSDRARRTAVTTRASSGAPPAATGRQSPHADGHLAERRPERLALVAFGGQFLLTVAAASIDGSVSLHLRDHHPLLDRLQELLAFGERQAQLVHPLTWLSLKSTKSRF